MAVSKDKLDLDFQKYLQQPLQQWGLAEGALLIARQEYPALDSAKVLERLGEMAKEAGRRFQNAPGPLDKVAALNDYLFRELGFHGDRESYDDPRNSYLPDILERRMGIPIGLAVVYLEMAWRNSLGLFGINFPGHFLVAWKESESNYRLNSYLDVFDGGRVLSGEDFQGLLDRHAGGASLEPSRHLHNAGVRDILHRMLANLKAHHASKDGMERALWEAEWMLRLKSTDFLSLRDKGLFLFSLGRLDEAEKSLSEYLESSKEPADHAAVWKVLYSIRAQNPVNMN